MLRKRMYLVAAVALVFGGVLPAGSASADTSKSCDETCQAVRRLEQEVKSLRSELDARSAEIEELKARVDGGGAGAGVASDAGVKIESKKLKYSSKDKKFEFQVGGRVMADVTKANLEFDGFRDPALQANAAAVAAANNTIEGREGWGTEIRRARLFMSGRLYGDWKFKAQLGFAGDQTDIEDAYIEYAGIPNTGLKVGHFKAPFSLNELTSSKYITFMERSGVAGGFAPSRKWGVQASTHGDNWTATGGFFTAKDGTDELDNLDESYIIGGRLTFAPIAEKDRNVHLGLAAYYTDLRDAPSALEIGIDPAAHNARRFADIDLGGIDSYYVIGPELAAVWGPLSLQAEYALMSTSAAAAMPAPDFHAWYVYGSWFPGGGQRNYNPAKGVFERTKVENQFEVALRYDQADLNDAGVFGGEQKLLTGGVNFYANPNVVFKLNYVHGKIGDAPTSRTGLPGLADINYDIAEFRAQVDF